MQEQRQTESRAYGSFQSAQIPYQENKPLSNNQFIPDQIHTQTGTFLNQQQPAQLPAQPQQQFQFQQQQYQGQTDHYKNQSNQMYQNQVQQQPKTDYSHKNIEQKSSFFSFSNRNQQELKKLEFEIIDKNIKINQLEADILKNRQMIEDLQRQIVSKDQLNIELQRQLSSKEQNLVDLKQQFSETVQLKQSAEQTLVEKKQYFEARLNEMEEDEKNLKKKYRDIVDDKTVLEQKLSAKIKVIQEQEDDISRLRKYNRDQSDQFTGNLQLKLEQERIENENKNLKQKYQEAQNKIEELEKQVRELKNQQIIIPPKSIQPTNVSKIIEVIDKPKQKLSGQISFVCFEDFTTDYKEFTQIIDPLKKESKNNDYFQIIYLNNSNTIVNLQKMCDSMDFLELRKKLEIETQNLISTSQIQSYDSKGGFLLIKNSLKTPRQFEKFRIMINKIKESSQGILQGLQIVEIENIKLLQL